MIPPLHDLETAVPLTLMLFLDTKRPLSEPGWCKSGNVEDWLSREFGRASIPSDWKSKIRVMDPDEVSYLAGFLIRL
jgi:20S proteasome subunit alpha 6